MSGLKKKKTNKQTKATNSTNCEKNKGKKQYVRFKKQRQKAVPTVIKTKAKSSMSGLTKAKGSMSWFTGHTAFCPGFLVCDVHLMQRQKAVSPLNVL